MRLRFRRRIETALAVLLVALLAAYALAAREFLADGRPLIATSQPEDTPAAQATRPAAVPLGANAAVALARGNAARTGEIGDNGPRRVLNFLWSVPTGGEIVAEPVVAGGVVYVGSGDGILYAIETATGSIRWRFPTPAAITGAVAVAGEVVYLAAEPSALYAIDAATGRERWRYRLPSDDSNPAPAAARSPLVAGDAVYLAGVGAPALADGRLLALTGRAAPMIALDIADGGERWSFRPESDGLTALDPASGAVLWHLARSRLTPGTPAIQHGAVFLTEMTDDGVALLAVDAATGQVRWTEPTGQAQALGLALTGGRALVGTAAPEHIQDGGGLFAILTDPEIDGERLNWRNASRLPDPASGLRFTARPIVAGGFVYAVTSEGALLAMDLASGQIRRRFNAGTVLGAPTVAGEAIYVGGRDGRLFALGSDDATAPVTGTATVAVTLTPGTFVVGQVVEVGANNAALHPIPDPVDAPIAMLTPRTQVVIAGAAVLGGTTTYWPVEVVATGQRGYVEAGALTPSASPLGSSLQVTPASAWATPTWPAEGYQPDQTVYVAIDGVVLRPYPSEASGTGTPLPPGTILLVAGETVNGDALGFRWLQVTLASDPSVAGFVREDQVTSAPTSNGSAGGSRPASSPAGAAASGTPSSDATSRPATTGLNASAESPDLRYVEQYLAVDLVALAAGDATAIAALHDTLAANLRFFQPGRCQPALVVIAVGAAEEPDRAIAATAVFVDAVRATHSPAFSTIDVLGFADAATPAGHVRLRVYYVRC